MASSGNDSVQQVEVAVEMRRVNSEISNEGEETADMVSITLNDEEEDSGAVGNGGPATVKLDATGGGDVLTVPSEGGAGKDGVDGKGHKRNESKISFEIVVVPEETQQVGSPAPVLALSTLSDDIASSSGGDDNGQLLNGNGHQQRLEFSEDLDAPGTSERVYGFNDLVKDKTLQRGGLAGRLDPMSLIRIWSDLPRVKQIAAGLMLIIILACAGVLIYFLA